MKIVASISVVLSSLVVAVGCSDEDTSGGGTPDSGTPAATGGASGSGGAQGTGGAPASGGAAPASGGADAGPPLDCTADNWSSGLSEACWSCLCGACAEKLNLCNSDCTDILECAFEKNTFVNQLAEINCEIQATAVECLTTPATQDQAGALIQFDTCLISGGAAAGSFRVCDTECQIPYSGDVCTRYPQP